MDVRLPPVGDLLLDRVQAQRFGCETGGSPLYVAVLDAVAAEMAADGRCRDVLAPYADEPVHDAMVLRFLAAVHEMVLEGAAPGLARHYPSVGGVPGPDVGRELVAVVATHGDRLRARTALPCQTNEVGRSAALLGGFLAVASSGPALPLRVLEIGASAGLNLRFDHYRYEAGGAAFGPAASPVRFLQPWESRAPDLAVGIEVAERKGCDAAPLDPTDPHDQLRLRASLWPDQVQRRHLLDGALEVAATVPVAVDRADAATWLADQLAEPVEGVTTVIVHSIMWNYLAADTRTELERLLDDAGGRATPTAPLARLLMEPASASHAEVHLTRWPAEGRSSRTEVLARTGFHGPPIRWLA